MGGRALKNLSKPIRRYSKEEFVSLSNELVIILQKYFVQVAVPLYYRNKESFGDIDILVCGRLLTMENKSMRDLINELFSPEEIVKNDYVYSFDYKEIQIDIIEVKGNISQFESTFNYLSYNDLGNLIGRLAQSIGLKFGQDGLKIKHHFKGQNIGDIHVSNDMEKILTFLDLSYSDWFNGFDNLEDIFNFISKSKYFNPDRYHYEELNKINRDRNKKRSNYILFLHWCDEYFPDRSNMFIADPDKSVYLKQIIEYFPESDIEYQIRELEYYETLKLYVKSKFNVGNIKKEYNISNEKITKFVEEFKDYFLLYNNGENFLHAIAMSSRDLISQNIKNFYENNFINNNRN